MNVIISSKVIPLKKNLEEMNLIPIVTYLQQLNEGKSSSNLCQLMIKKNLRKKKKQQRQNCSRI